MLSWYWTYSFHLSLKLSKGPCWYCFVFVWKCHTVLMGSLGIHHRSKGSIELASIGRMHVGLYFYAYSSGGFRLRSWNCFSHRIFFSSLTPSVRTSISILGVFWYLDCKWTQAPIPFRNLHLLARYSWLLMVPRTEWSLQEVGCCRYWVRRFLHHLLHLVYCKTSIVSSEVILTGLLWLLVSPSDAHSDWDSWLALHLEF